MIVFQVSLFMEGSEPMKIKSVLSIIVILAGLAVVSAGAYFIGAWVQAGSVAGAYHIPPLSDPHLPAQMRDDITVNMEGAYADANRVVFALQVGGRGKDYTIEQASLKDAEGEEINSSFGSTVNGKLIYMDFGLASELKASRLKGQLVFTVTEAAGTSAADFRFDLDLPVAPALTFEPKQTISPLILEVLLDRVVITPAYTQVYLCYQKPDNADWMVGSDATLKIGNQQAAINSYNLLYDSAMNMGDKGGEQGWTPPVQDGRCVKLGFPIGDAHPQSLILTVPTLEQSLPEVIPADRLAFAYGELKSQGIDMEWHVVDHGAYPEYKKLPAGMSEEQANHKFVEALGYVYNGGWKFDIQLNPPKDSIPVFSTSIYGAPASIPLSEVASDSVVAVPGRIQSFDISPDMKTIALGTSNGVMLYDFNDHKLVGTLKEPENVFRVAWSPDGKMLAVGAVDSQYGEGGKLDLKVWDLSTRKVIFAPEVSQETSVLQYGALAWSPDGKLLATSAFERGIVVFDLQTGNIVSHQEGFLVDPYSISWSPDGSRLVATGDLGYGFRRWRIDINEAVRLYEPQVDAASQLAWSPDGKRIASIHDNGGVCFWTVDTNQCDGFIRANTNGRSSLAWSSDGSQLVTGGEALRIWDTKTGKLIKAFGQESNPAYTQLEWPLPDKPLVALETRYGDQEEQTLLRFWNVSTGSLIVEFQGQLYCGQLYCGQ